MCVCVSTLCQAAAQEQAARPFKAILCEMPAVNVMIHPGATVNAEHRTNHRMRWWNSHLRQAWMNITAKEDMEGGGAFEAVGAYPPDRNDLFAIKGDG